MTEDIDFEEIYESAPCGRGRDRDRDRDRDAPDGGIEIGIGFGAPAARVFRSRSLPTMKQTGCYPP